MVICLIAIENVCVFHDKLDDFCILTVYLPCEFSVIHVYNIMTILREVLNTDRICVICLL